MKKYFVKKTGEELKVGDLVCFSSKETKGDTSFSSSWIGSVTKEWLENNLKKGYLRAEETQEGPTNKEIHKQAKEAVEEIVKGGPDVIIDNFPLEYRTMLLKAIERIFYKDDNNSDRKYGVSRISDDILPKTPDILSTPGWPFMPFFATKEDAQRAIDIINGK